MKKHSTRSGFDPESKRMPRAFYKSRGGRFSLSKSWPISQNGTAINPIKGHMPLYPDHDSYINAMPSWLKKREHCRH